jgi:hypothetical protein
MDRRTFITAGAWLTAADYLPACIARAAKLTDVRATFAVFDQDLPQADEWIAYAARQQWPAFDIGGDVGALWYTRLAPRAARQPVTLVGVARASDVFVLARLALVPGHALRTDSTRRGTFGARRGATAVAFMIPA